MLSIINEFIKATVKLYLFISFYSILKKLQSVPNQQPQKIEIDYAVRRNQFQ